MRKASSTEGLNRLAEARHGEHAGRQHIVRSASLGRSSPASAGGRKAKSDQNLKQLCGTPSGLNQIQKRSSTVASAAPLDFYALQPDVMSTEMAEDVMEASFARGLAAAECFELYGPVRQAPELSGASPLADHAASSQQLATSQQLAYCLATPFTGTDKNMGEILRSEVDKMDANRELQTQLRYAEELRHRKEAVEEEDEEVDGKLEEHSVRRARLRRRPSDEVLDEQLMQEVAITGYRQPVKGPGELPSADAKATLDSIYGSMDDTSNKLVLPQPIREGTGDKDARNTPYGHTCNTPHATAQRINIMATSCAPELF